MDIGYLERGALAGVVGGLVYGSYIALVGNKFVDGLEQFEHGHSYAEPAVSGLTAALVSVGGGVLWGLLLGVTAFGVAYYFLEPALPEGMAGRLTLAGAGFLVVSGAPWLVLPPQPPGVEHSLATGTRTLWYAGMMGAGGVAAGLCLLLFQRVRDRTLAPLVGLAPLLVLLVPVVLAPPNQVHGDVPPALAAAFRSTVLFGQVTLWATVASVHTWLGDGTSVTVACPGGVSHADQETP